MSWSERRTRPVRKEITFTRDEWEEVRKLQEKLAHYSPEYRSFGFLARRLMLGRSLHVTCVRPLTDPEPIAAAVVRIGVNVNEITRLANADGHATAGQLDEVALSLEQVRRLLGRLFDDYTDAVEGRR